MTRPWYVLVTGGGEDMILYFLPIFFFHLLELLNSLTTSCEDNIINCKLGFTPDVDTNCCSTTFNPPIYIYNHKCYTTLGRIREGANKKTLLVVCN